MEYSSYQIIKDVITELIQSLEIERLYFGVIFSWCLLELNHMICHHVSDLYLKFLNPILTGFFESKFLLGGGGVNLTPPSDLGPEGADRREILHGCEDTSKEYCYGKKNAKNGLFIILL